MDTNGSRGTWVMEEENRNDFSTKSSPDGYTGHKEIYRNSPNAIRSQADIFLTEIEKQLEVTESKYESAMKRLRYTKMLYGNAAGSMSLESNDYDRIDDSPITGRNSQSDASSSAQIVDDKECENNLLTFGTTQYLDETENTQNKAQEEAQLDPKSQPTEPDSKPFKVESSTNGFQNIHVEDRKNTNDQSYSFERARGSQIKFQFIKDTMGNCVIDNVNQIREEHFLNDIPSRRVHPYQLQLAEYSKGLQEQFEEESRNAESPTLENQDIHSSELNSSMQQERKKPEIHLNLAESVQSFQTTTKIIKIRHDKQRRTISSKTFLKSNDDSMGQTARRKKPKKRGLKTSNSRCTTATKETSISENKKETRKRSKPRGHPTRSNLQLSQNRRRHNVIAKNENNVGEVVQLYVNSALKSGSLSVVSSKHSKVMETRMRGFNNGTKIDQPWRTKGNHRLVDNHGKRTFDDIEEQRSKKQEANELDQSNENCANDDENFRDDLQGTTDFRSGEPNRINYETDRPVDQSGNNIIKEYRDDVNQEIRQDCQSPHILSPSFDPFSTRNYALPTVSSRMKQVHRSYFNRFNFRNIPFVVGTSVTPSYNLGLNIQEALSLMKTRQLMPSRISPMLISNVSKGLKPVSTLFECIRDEREPLMEERNIPLSINSRGMTSMYQSSLNDEKTSRPIQLTPYSLKTPGLSFIPDTETLYEAQESSTNPQIEFTPKKQKTQSICSSIKFNNEKSLEPKLELTQSFLLRQRQEELNMGESQTGKWQTVTQGSKGIREVLMNFHDQYESMIKKFEKLQEQSRKSSDKSLEKEIAALEKELNMKEEEIKAVASLYQEVMILKRQMRMLYERNSLVCVSTEAPGSPTYPHFSMRAQTANPIRLINVYRRGGSVSNHGPPTSTKLAGMLRQIKTFQKQLKSDT